MTTVIWTTASTRLLIGFAAVQVEPYPSIADEPVSVADVVRHLKWPSGTPDEADVPRWIAAARTVIERDTRLALAPQTWDLYLDAWGDVPGWLPLPLHPVVSVDEIAIIGSDGAETAVDPSDYALVATRRPGRLVFTAAASLATARALAPIRIRYTAGYDAAAIPQDLLHALLMQVADFALHRGDEREPARARTVSGAAALIQRYMLPEVA
jgi:uncharacterized phiE125 gp8 family phage protein